MGAGGRILPDGAALIMPTTTSSVRRPDKALTPPSGAVLPDGATLIRPTGTCCGLSFTPPSGTALLIPH
ncbi:hypothetical protein E2R62_10075 [Citrobacter rodentium]|uniref:Uncharacterized protein n=1 Tax=Citrobacter rodentium TaxID=67825 RepID=A0A482PPG7_CITRO|nr:hypothetical protein E2R62_10075 [Citrobacter rodentium]